MKHGFLEESARSPFQPARVAVLPVPYEATVSYGLGTRHGPRAILDASVQLELLDERSGAEPWRVGVWTADPVRVMGGTSEEIVARIAERHGALMDAGKWVVMLGGEHGITPGGVRAAALRHPDLEVVQLDAHADLRETYEGTRWSHACAMARCLEIAPVRGIGLRSYSREEADRMASGLPEHRAIHSWEMDRPDWAERALEGLDGKPVYLTVDVDYFDPAVIPATGTPEPGGAQWWPTLDFLSALFRRARVIACDVVELAPAPDLHHADYTVARLVYKLIGLAFPSA